MLLPLLHHLGPTWLAKRLLWSAERRLGLLEYRMPREPWSAFGFTEEEAATWRMRAPCLPLARLDRADLSRQLESWALASGHSPVAEAEAFDRGFCRVFSGRLVEVGRPPRWTQNVLTGGSVDPSTHWSRCSDAGAEDIKGIWELSRFAWVFPLVRAWVIDGDARHVERFWSNVEDWKKQNPPNRGPQWMCGQEASLRLIALTFGVQAFRHHPATTDARLVLASRMAEATARRIEGHLDYALSQQNNHGIAEAVGLMTAGVFWPTLPGAGDWRRRGRSALWQQVEALVGPDGGFSQHSTNYHRLLLDLLVWAELVCRAAGSTLPLAVRRKAIAATDFLAALLEADGTVPRYGADDGANLFPLSGCGFEDFRPTVGAALALFKGERLPAGPWDETALLLLGPLPSSAAPSVHAPVVCRDAGVVELRHPRGTLFFRAPTVFRTRPSHADQLHVSLRWDGEWIAEDPGSYSYNEAGGWDGLAGSRFHNVVTVGDEDAMRRFRRFLWLPWTACDLRAAQDDFTAAHLGFPGFKVRRRVIKVPNGFVIVDRLSGLLKQPGRCTLRWHGRSRAGLEQLTIACSVASQEEYVTALPDGGEGWHSTRYGSKDPSWCRRITATGNEVTFVTALGCSLRLEAKSFFVDGEEYPLE
ncbi:MAG: heparinase II/III domain-containing protein [Opitutales bacterium]